MAVAAEQTQEVRRSFGLRMVVAVLGLVATFLTSVVAVRTLDARAAAGFLAILGALMLGPMVGRLGLGQSAIRAIAAAGSPAEVAVQVVAHLRAVALLSVVTAPLVAWVATVVVREDRGLVVALVAGLIVLETLRLTISDVYAALGRITWSVAATHHSRSILALLAMLVVALVQGGETTLTTLLSAYAGTSLVLLLVVVVRLPLRSGSTGTRWWRSMLVAMAAGAWLFTVELGAFLVGRGDVWLAGAAFPADEVLLYSTASVLAMQVTVLEGLANIAITPVAARLWAEGRRDRVFALLRASATLSTAVTVVLVIAVWLLAPQVLAIYGEGLDDAAPYLAVLATGGLGMAVFGACAVLLVVTGNGRTAAGAVGVAMLVAVPAAVLAAVLGGPLALSIASASATALLFGSYAFACRRAFGTAPLPGLHLRRSLLLLAGRGPDDDDTATDATATAATDNSAVTGSGAGPGVVVDGPGTPR
ncbi:lipopolysaccharide biosynthesis protein [Modestobacter italicus]|uniref:lipopolysaccharide biosynthesis protein n=1 Tax=Modestobacter italicus (strain DSM 44449 / CECT 9708 / BC 501) TaxID=2732864 RepID=UPI001C9772E5|nr:MATE family efflux transporter [Modestobacter italicus]